MTKDTVVLTGNSVFDPHKLDQLMNLSGELVIIRSQYARVGKLLQQNLSRQKEVAQGVARARALLEVAVKEPTRAQKSLADLGVVLSSLDDRAYLDEMSGHIQAIGHTTSALEKASSALQSGIVHVRVELSGGKTDASSAIAIMPTLLAVVGVDIYAFPLSAVTEIINVPSKDIYTVDGNTTMKLRDHALSLIELSNVIKASPNNSSNQGEVKRVVVITDGESRLGVPVDELLGKDDIVLKPFSRHFSGVKGIVGASILADGNVALILDPVALIKESK